MRSLCCPSDERWLVRVGYCVTTFFFFLVAHRNKEVLAAPCVRKGKRREEWAVMTIAITSPAPPYCGSTDVVCPRLLVLWSFWSNTLNRPRLLQYRFATVSPRGGGSGSNDHHPRESDTSEHAEGRVVLHIDRAMRDGFEVVLPLIHMMTTGIADWVAV